MFTYQLYPATHPIMPGHRCSPPVGPFVISLVKFKKDEHVGHFASPSEVVFTGCHEHEGQAALIPGLGIRPVFVIVFVVLEIPVHFGYAL